MKRHGRSSRFALFVSGLFLFQIAVALLVDLRRPEWGDEDHIVQTVRDFGERITLEKIKSYKEPYAPLPFILYALWGRAFGFELHILRLFSLVIALATYVLFYRLLTRLRFNDNLALLATGFWALHPYMIGLSVFVFTDILALLFLIVACQAMIKPAPLLLAFALAAATWCRQYFVFVAGAAAFYYAVKWRLEKDAGALRLLSACLLAGMSFLGLILFWGGFMPAYEGRDYFAAEMRFHPNFLTLYVCLFPIYLLPFVAWRRRAFYASPAVLGFSLLPALSYWLFPVAASRFALDSGVATVGFFHKLLKSTLGSQGLEHVILFVFFWAGLPVVFFFAKDFYNKLRQGPVDFALFVDTAMLFFLLLMPFAFQVWEKYFMPIIPLALIRLLLIEPQERT